MRASRTALLGAAASAALLAGAATGFAQAPQNGQQYGQQTGRVITVPPGAVVLVLPAGSVPVVAPPMAPEGVLSFPDMPSPVAMIRQMDQQMDRMVADMQRSFAAAAPGSAWGPAWLDPDRTIDAAMRDMPATGGTVQGVVVTMISNGHGTCTQRITYAGNGAAPVVHVASTGNGCGDVGVPGSAPVPAAQPELRAPATAPMPHLIEVKARTTRKPAKPLVYAEAAPQ